MSTKSYITSYNALFTRRNAETPAVDRIEIPLIQRDYAQGREGDAVKRIRNSFLGVLYKAVTGGEPVSLDFIYGDVESGTLRPLDGQQRLTTLFLLHWYLAFRTNRVGHEHGWKAFTYATRPSARLFCERLAECQPPPVKNLSQWIKDQSWYLHTWQHDPTIQSMLVMLDTIHQLFGESDCAAAWERLVDPSRPAISFHVLPMEQMGLGEDLYIKMNSRGKPLTNFENFKARFEQLLDQSCPERVQEFATKVDGNWADVLWTYRGSDSIIDDEFLRYFHFVTEISEWRAGRMAEGELITRASGIYGPEVPERQTHLDFLFGAFDTWVEAASVPGVFGDLFATQPPPLDSCDTSKVVLFGQQDVDLFFACCRDYGQMRGRNRVFGWPQTLYLYGVLLHRIRDTPEVARRLRILRNLIDASSNELRLERMPALLSDLERVVADENFDGVAAFNQAQVADEQLKAELLAEHPDLERTLFQIEDHPLLHGCLAAFEIDAESLESRASAFHLLFADPGCWPSLTGALLSIGDYSRQLNYRTFQFGSGSNPGPWRELLTGAGRPNLGPTRDALGRLLDTIAIAAGGHHRETLDAIQQEWLKAEAAAGHGLDWRWYLVKYPAMREGNSGVYVRPSGDVNYDICMLQKSQMNSWYRDAYLFAVYRECGGCEEIKEPWFFGNETARWMHLQRSGVGIRGIEEGFVLRPPPAAEYGVPFARVCEKYGIGGEHLLRVPQVETDGRHLDTHDRVELAAALMRDLVEAGL